MPSKPVVRASSASYGRYSGLNVDSMEDTTLPSSPVSSSVHTTATVPLQPTPSSYASFCLQSVFDSSKSDVHRAQALYQVFIETASELETSSQFSNVMTRIAENLATLGCKTKPCTLHCDRSHNEPCTLEHAKPCTLKHAEPCTLTHAELCTLTHAEPCTLNHFFVTPEPCVLPHAEPCTMSHAEPCTILHIDPCTLPHNEPCTLNHFPVEPIAVTIPCPLAHNDPCTLEHAPPLLNPLPAHVTTPLPEVMTPLPTPPPLALTASKPPVRLNKRKRFKKTQEKRKEYRKEYRVRLPFESDFISDHGMDSEGFFPDPILGYDEEVNEFLEDSDNYSDMTAWMNDPSRDPDIKYWMNHPPIDSPLPPPIISLPKVTLPPSAPLPTQALPIRPLQTDTQRVKTRAQSAPITTSEPKIQIKQRAQSAPPDVSKNTLTARRCTTQEPSPSSFVKFMDVPVTFSREDFIRCLKDNRKWSMVDISNMEMFAMKNKDSTVTNVLKVNFKDDAQSTMVKRMPTTSISFGETTRRCRPWYLSTRSQ